MRGVLWKLLPLEVESQMLEESCRGDLGAVPVLKPLMNSQGWLSPLGVGPGMKPVLPVACPREAGLPRGGVALSFLPLPAPPTFCGQLICQKACQGPQKQPGSPGKGKGPCGAPSPALPCSSPAPAFSWAPGHHSQLLLGRQHPSWLLRTGAPAGALLKLADHTKENLLVVAVAVQGLELGRTGSSVPLHTGGVYFQ